MTEEKSTEPTQIEAPESVSEDAGNVDPEKLLAEMEKLGITSVEKLQGVATASQQAGRNAQLLGDERKQTELMQQQILELQNKLNSRQVTSGEYYSEEPDTGLFRDYGFCRCL